MIVDSIRCSSERGAGRLNDEDIGAADVLVDLKGDFGVGKPAQAGLTEFHPEELADVSRKLRVIARDFQFSETCWSHLDVPAGAGPRRKNAGRSTGSGRSLAKLVGRKDSNLQSGSKGRRLSAWPRPNTPGQTPIVAELRAACLESRAEPARISADSGSWYAGTTSRALPGRSQFLRAASPVEQAEYRRSGPRTSRQTPPRRRAAIRRMRPIAG